VFAQHQTDVGLHRLRAACLLGVLDIIPHRAVSKAQLLANLMKGGALCMEFGNANLHTLCNGGSGYPLALGFRPGHACFDPFTHQSAFKLG